VDFIGGFLSQGSFLSPSLPLPPEIEAEHPDFRDVWELHQHLILKLPKLQIASEAKTS
jgi:hypothetical protein